MDHMDSIWLEDDRRDKLHPAHPHMEVLNSDTPYLQTSTVDLPPLPPTSYFSTLMAQKAEEQERLKLRKKKSGAKLLDAFMSSFKSDKSQKELQKEKQRLRTKISTPFGFSHISHIDKDTTITNKTFEIPVPRHSVIDDAYNTKLSAHSTPSPTSFMVGPTTQAVAYNRTEPTVHHSSVSSTLPRSSSLANSLSSNTFSTTRASISTTATSTKAMSRKNTQSHHHTVSSSSIEQLTKLEKYQISKQCAPGYKSTTISTSPSSTPAVNQADSMNWDTPSPGNAVRQSWIYAIDQDSPLAQKEKSKKLYTTENTMLRESMLLMNMNTPLKEHIDKFTTTLNSSFDEGPEFAEVQRGMQELSVMFGVNDSPRDEGEVQEAMASMRAARFTRMSRDLMKDLSEGDMNEFKERLEKVLKEGHEDSDEEDFEEVASFSTISSSTESSQSLL